MGIRPQQQPIPTSQISQDVLDQTKVIHQDVCKNAMQAYIMYKAYHGKKANASNLKKAEHVYVLQPKVCFTAYFFEKVLPNNNYLVSKIGTNKTQVLQRMRMRQFTPRQPPADIRITPQ